MRSTPFENGAISCEMPVVTKVAVFRSIHTERRVMVIVDNAKYHQPRMHRDWQQAQADHFALDFLPPYSPDLNPIERVWKLTRRLAVHNRYFRHLEEVMLAEQTQFTQWRAPNEVLRKLCPII